ncbi:3',5'-cyclic-nucleotide phosphodiesterase pde1 [Orbilia ellipsospora]|uniref:3',5'-cyclic-nucleotide phosphodiesterase pde1 n=1 Tax=Orbilia ellipsospora TaxID=2528407 RepID=A0AAV9XE86_9PEZI
MLPHNAKKTIAALPPTIEALKTHIFNDVIWPNLTDENGGVGFLTYQRLVDASVVDGKIEYRKIVDGLSVQAWPVSHGHCMHNHTHRGSDAAMIADDPEMLTRDKSMSLRAATGLVKRQTWHKKCVYDSSCYFIRDDYTEKEILIFGDVEPDSVSISEPRRNVYIWNYAAEKIHRGVLSAIFIESSYDIHQKDEFLYGHMTPRHIIEELQVLASKVLLHREREARRYSMPLKKRRTNEQRASGDSIMQIDPFDASYFASMSAYNSDNESDVPRSPTDVEGLSSSSYDRRRSSNTKRRRSEEAGSIGSASASGMEYTSAPATVSPIINGTGSVDNSFPLRGLRVVIIHVKDDFDDDRDVRQSILNNLKKLEEKAGLGCTFELAENGGSSFF